MISAKTKKWIDAGIEIASNPYARVLCPECGNKHLTVKDLVDDKTNELMERMLYCEACGANNFLRMKIK